MSARRGFLAMVGGAPLSGTVQRRASAETPTLILPPRLVAVSADRPLLDAMRAERKSPLDIGFAIKCRLPRAAYDDWIEEGLQRSMLFDPPDMDAINRRILAAEAQHGSLIEAIRAGALRGVL